MFGYFLKSNGNMCYTCSAAASDRGIDLPDTQVEVIMPPDYDITYSYSYINGSVVKGEKYPSSNAIE